MWLLESDDGEVKQQHRLLLGVEFTVGRRGCNLNLDDRSVSRKHAILVATMPDPFADRSLLHVKDISSFGTRINKKKAEQNVSAPLNDGDKIIFGSIKSTYWVRFSPLVVTSSCLEKPAKIDLQRTLKILGGKVVAEWGPSCTHLVMHHLSITVKVISALVAQKSVVTIDYFKTLIESIKNVNVPTPKESSFLPKVSDSLAVRHTSTFQPKLQRKALLNGKTFIFVSASQLKKMQEAINLAGGCVKLYSEKKDIPDEELAADTNLIMSPPSSGLINKELVSHIETVLKSYGKRMITDAEVGHAVLSCSIQEYCNPNVNPGKPLDPLASQTMQTQSQDPFNCSTQSSMPLISNESMKNKFNESRSDAKPSSLHHEDVSAAEKTSDSTEENTIESISKKRRRSSVEAGVLEDESGEEAAGKKQCLFKIPVFDESYSSTRKSKSVTLVADTESQQTFIRPKPATVVVDSDPDEDESESLFDRPESSKSKDSATCSKKVSSVLVQDTASLDVKDSEENNLDLSAKIVGKEMPSTAGGRRLGKKKPDFVVEDSQSQSAALAMSVPNIETPVLIKSEVVDPAFENTTQQSKTLLQEPKSQVIKEEPQTENSSKEDGPSKNDQRRVLADINLPEGFLTTRLPIKNQVTKIKREEDLEEKELPKCCIETVFTDLIKRQPSRLPPNPDVASSSEAPEGFIYYRGKLVRNFKKFKKNALPQGFSLPRIIGGSDLIPHMASRSKEIDEWMRQTQAQESQQNEEERRSEDLFTWDSRGKGKRSR